MTDNVIKKIYADCPILFRNCSVDDSSGRPSLPLYVESGWQPLIYDLCSELEKIALQLREDGANEDALPTISTIKQKFCQFRCYLSNGTPKMDELVEKYAWLAPKICERCGIYGAKIRNLEECYFVLCDTCTEIRIKEREERFKYGISGSGEVNNDSH